MRNTNAYPRRDPTCPIRFGDSLASRIVALYSSVIPLHDFRITVALKMSLRGNLRQRGGRTDYGVFVNHGDPIQNRKGDGSIFQVVINRKNRTVPFSPPFWISPLYDLQKPHKRGEDPLREGVAV